MKILNSYKKIAKEFVKEAAWDRKFGEPLPTLEDVMKEAEVDDDKIIKYKDKEGESQEMTAGAAKKQPDDHPAKVAYNKMADDDGDDKKDSGGKLGGSDFDRDSDDKDDKPKGKLSPKKQAAVDELEDLSNPDEIESWIYDNQFYLRKGRIGNVGQMNVDKFVRKFRDLEDTYRDDEDEYYDTALPAFKDMINKTMDRYREKEESIKVIDGKKYKAIKESKEPTKSTIHPFKKTYKKIGGK